MMTYHICWIILKLCSLILGIEPQIRGVFVYHHNGELLAGGMRNGIQAHLPLEEITKSIYNTISRWQTRKSLYPFFGAGKYSITEYEKVKRITFPLSMHSILVVSVEIEIDHSKVIEKILQLINR